MELRITTSKCLFLYGNLVATQSLLYNSPFLSHNKFVMDFFCTLFFLKGSVRKLCCLEERSVPQLIEKQQSVRKEPSKKRKRQVQKQ